MLRLPVILAVLAAFTAAPARAQSGATEVVPTHPVLTDRFVWFARGLLLQVQHRGFPGTPARSSPSSSSAWVSALAGFYAGGYVALVVAERFAPGAVGVAIFLLGGAVGALFAALVMDWAIIVLSCMVGATLVAASIGVARPVGVLVYAGLVAAGVLVQAWLMRRTRRRPSADRAHSPGGMRAMRARIFLLLKVVAALLVLGVLGLLGVRACDAQRGPPLERWHTYSPSDLTAGKSGSSTGRATSRPRTRSSTRCERRSRRKLDPSSGYPPIATSKEARSIRGASRPTGTDPTSWSRTGRRSVRWSCCTG